MDVIRYKVEQTLRKIDTNELEYKKNQKDFGYKHTLNCHMHTYYVYTYTQGFWLATLDPLFPVLVHVLGLLSIFIVQVQVLNFLPKLHWDKEEREEV